LYTLFYYFVKTAYENIQSVQASSFWLCSNQGWHIIPSIIVGMDLADSAGITGVEPTKYASPEEQDEVIKFILNLPPKTRDKMINSISEEFNKMSK